MRLIICLISFYLLAVALASSVPSLATTTHAQAISTTAATPTPTPTASPTDLMEYRTVTCFSTPAVYGDLERHAALDSDSPVFRKRLYNDRLSLSTNYANAREIAISFLKNSARQVGKYLLTLDYGALGNIVLRAAVRSFTPGYGLQLLDSGAWQQIAFDVATSAYMRESFPQLPALPSADYTDTNTNTNTDVLDIQLPTQLPSLTDLRWGLKYTLAHMDMSALISLGLRAAVSCFELDATVNTANAMALIDIGMHVVFRSHAPPFHRFGDVLQSLDTVLPSLELPSLVSGLPHPPLLPFKPAELEEDSEFPPRRPIGFTRPYWHPSDCDIDDEPIHVTVYLSQSSGTSSKAESSHHEQRNADRPSRPPQGLSGYVIFEDSPDSIIRDVLRILIAVIASGGVVISIMKMIQGFRKAEQDRQDLIKMHALKALAYLPWERRVALLKTLTAIRPSRMTKLAPNYKIAIRPNKPEAQIVAHVTRLVCALSPERRKDLVHILAIASLPPLPPSDPPDPADPIPPSSTSLPSPLAAPGDTTTNTADTSLAPPSPSPQPPPPPPPPEADNP